MDHRVRIPIASAAFLVACASGVMAEDPANTSRCGDPKSHREVAQDEIRTSPELCGWRDDSLHFERDMILSQKEEPPLPKINLSMEQRHVIKEIVLKDMKPKRAPADTAAAIGDAVPPGVEVQPFPPEIYGKIPQLKSHGFFVRGNQVVVVSQKDNKIEDLID
jgi:hypothetical protein